DRWKGKEGSEGKKEAVSEGKKRPVERKGWVGKKGRWKRKKRSVKERRGRWKEKEGPEGEKDGSEGGKDGPVERKGRVGGTGRMGK
ncbi:hypothetical protein Q4E93_14415, partial [Flavitalea sp. BT771]|uniref:hypothetical protein n=1 Tax=Flavitalea sp. BT771 TaxID=3063329 RepID=UPI0026E1D15C